MFLQEIFRCASARTTSLHSFLLCFGKHLFNILKLTNIVNLLSLSYNELVYNTSRYKLKVTAKSTLKLKCKKKT